MGVLHGKASGFTPFTSESGGIPTSLTFWIRVRPILVFKSVCPYGSELVAARIAPELIIELRYKLHMLGN